MKRESLATGTKLSPKAAFLAQEYKNLWTEHGLEEIFLSSPRRPSPTVSRTPSAKSGRASARQASSFTSLEQIRAFIGRCERCRLCEQRTNIVFGAGNAKSRLMFVGEGPGADEDESGLPFVGQAGKLLTKIIEAMGQRREDFYIANVVKCRPPQNRTPQQDEIESCSPFLRAQIDVIQPQIVVSLGLIAATALTGQVGSMSNLRGRFHKLIWNPNILVMPTYHPAYLLRNPNAKRLVWEDIKIVQKQLEEKHA